MKWMKSRQCYSISRHDNYLSVCAIHWRTTPRRWSFSMAAATRSLSASCLFTATSDAWLPGVMEMSTLNRLGSEDSNFTRVQRPIRVAILQWGIVGVNVKEMMLLALSTRMFSGWITFSCSNVSGCSGSLMCRKISAGCGWRVVVSAFCCQRNNLQKLRPKRRAGARAPEMPPFPSILVALHPYRTPRGNQSRPQHPRRPLYRCWRACRTGWARTRWGWGSADLRQTWQMIGRRRQMWFVICDLLQLH